MARAVRERLRGKEEEVAQDIREALRIAAVEGSSAADAMTEALVRAGTRTEEEVRDELRPSAAPAGSRGWSARQIFNDWSASLGTLRRLAERRSPFYAAPAAGIFHPRGHLFKVRRQLHGDGRACSHGAAADALVRHARVVAAAVSLGNRRGAGGEFERKVGGRGASGRAASGCKEGAPTVRACAVGRNEPVVRDSVGRQ